MMSEGDPYDAGKNLLEFYRPVQREDKIGSFSFAARFWEDGSPRLTAYEYQGLTRSKCYRAGKPGHRITCTSCHEMHGGDPRGQLTEKMKTNAACIPVSPAICDTGTTDGAHQASCGIERKSLLQLS
jgi:predicted CXXCH cytochrome family protein